MRFLIDNALSPHFALALRGSGHDAVHVRDRGLSRATDLDVIALAVAEDRILLSSDTDFGTILALRGESKPSFVLFRGVSAPAEQERFLVAALPALEGHLLEGAVVVITRDRTRLRLLPIVR